MGIGGADKEMVPRQGRLGWPIKRQLRHHFSVPALREVWRFAAALES